MHQLDLWLTPFRGGFTVATANGDLPEEVRIVMQAMWRYTVVDTIRVDEIQERPAWIVRLNRRATDRRRWLEELLTDLESRLAGYAPVYHLGEIRLRRDQWMNVVLAVE